MTKKRLTILDEKGSVDLYCVCKLVFILIVGALVLIASYAIHDLIQQIISQYCKRDGILGYTIYAIVSIALVILFVYIGCWIAPDVAEHINLKT